MSRLLTGSFGGENEMMFRMLAAMMLMTLFPMTGCVSNESTTKVVNVAPETPAYIVEYDGYNFKLAVWDNDIGGLREYGWVPCYYFVTRTVGPFDWSKYTP